METQDDARPHESPGDGPARGHEPPSGSRKLTKQGLPEKLLELVHLRASQINGCSVCVDMHPKIARKLGETDERLFAVSAWREAPYFTDSERAALALTEAVTRVADREDPVPDAIWDEAAKHFDERELATLILSIANINVWNRLNATIRCRSACGRCESFLPSPCTRGEGYSARNLCTTSPNSSGACSNIQCPALAITAVCAPAMCAASTRHITDRLPVVAPPPISSVGVLIACASARV